MAYVLKTDVATKMAILYVINSFKEGVTSEILTEVAVYACGINYFLLRQHLFRLEEDEFITSFSSENGEMFIINEKGEQALEFFVKKLPYRFLQTNLFAIICPPTTWNIKLRWNIAKKASLYLNWNSRQAMQKTQKTPAASSTKTRTKFSATFINTLWNLKKNKKKTVSQSFFFFITIITYHHCRNNQQYRD